MDVDAANGREHEVFLDHVPDFHRAVTLTLRVLERHRHIIRPVDFLADNARAKRVAVQAHHQVQHGGAVVRLDGTMIFVCTQYFFGEVVAAALALFKGEARILRKVSQVYRLARRQRVALPHVGVGQAVDQVVEFQFALLEQVGDVLAIEIAQVKHAYLALERRHVVDDFLGFRLADGKVVVVEVELLDHLDKALDRERVVLRGDGELLALHFALAIAFQHSLVVVVQLVRLGDELLPRDSERDTATRAVENHDTDFVLEVVDGRGQGRLRNKQGFGGLVEGADLGDTDCIA